MRIFSLLLLCLTFFSCNNTSENEEKEEESGFTVEFYIETEESTVVESINFKDKNGDWVEVSKPDWDWSEKVTIPEGGEVAIEVSGTAQALVKVGYIAEKGIITRKMAKSKGGDGNFFSFDISISKVLE